MSKQNGDESAFGVAAGSASFMTKEQLRNDYNLLHVALSDSRQLSVAYPILARHGLMERTAHGYKSIDPDAVVRRARELIDRIADDVIQSIEPNTSGQTRPAEPL